MWCLMSDDYVQVPINEESTTFKRVVGARGTSVSAMVSGNTRMPPALLAAAPEITVLDIAVHPDGYEAFRKLRQWAWGKGFSVNWEPQDENPIVLTRTSHPMEQ